MVGPARKLSAPIPQGLERATAHLFRNEAPWSLPYQTALAQAGDSPGANATRSIEQSRPRRAGWRKCARGVLLGAPSVSDST
jgi:hypothetical protein